MGQLIEPTLAEIIETAWQREYFVTDVPKYQVVAPGVIRLFCCSRRNNFYECQYTVVMPAVSIIQSAKFCAEIAQAQNLIGMVH